MPKLYVLSGSDIGRVYEVEGESVILGRGKEADLVIHGASVSRRHARLERGPGGWRIIDLDSSNGVRLGGMRVSEGDIQDGETFRLGEVELRFRLPGASPRGLPDRVQEPELRSAPVSLDEPLDDHGGFDLEGDWDEGAALEMQPVRSAPKAPLRPAPEPKPASRSSAASRAALQYQRIENRGGLLSADLSQEGGVVRWLIYLLVLVFFLALAYGTYRLTTLSRRTAANLEEPAE